MNIEELKTMAEDLADMQKKIAKLINKEEHKRENEIIRREIDAIDEFATNLSETFDRAWEEDEFGSEFFSSKFVLFFMGKSISFNNCPPVFDAVTALLDDAKAELEENLWDEVE